MTSAAVPIPTTAVTIPMTAGPAVVPSVAPSVSTSTSATREAYVAEAKELNALVVAIRGTQWGQDCSPAIQRAVAHYCNRNGIDAVRHIEVLGGRIYLNAQFYDERGAPLVLAGTVVFEAPQFVHDDPRLATLVVNGLTPTMKEWAAREYENRTRLRIELGIPDDATGACVYRARVGDTVLVGHNWCGGSTKVKKKKDGTSYRYDPVGDAEPVKTAQSRAKRRAWRQIVVAVPALEATVGAIEASVKLVNAELAEIVTAEHEDAARDKMRTPLLKHGDNPYETGVASPHADAAAGTPLETDAPLIDNEPRSREEEEFELGLAREERPARVRPDEASPL